MARSGLLNASSKHHSRCYKVRDWIPLLQRAELLPSKSSQQILPANPPSKSMDVRNILSSYTTLSCLMPMAEH